MIFIHFNALKKIKSNLAKSLNACRYFQAMFTIIIVSSLNIKPSCYKIERRIFEFIRYANCNEKFTSKQKYSITEE